MASSGVDRDAIADRQRGDEADARHGRRGTLNLSGMAPGRNRSTRSASEWLIGPGNTPSKKRRKEPAKPEKWVPSGEKPSSTGSRSKEKTKGKASGKVRATGSGAITASGSGNAWLSVPEPSAPRRDSTNGDKPSGRPQTRKGRADGARTRGALASRLRRAQNELKSYEDLSANLSMRTEKLEAELRAEREQRLAQVAELEAELAEVDRGKRSPKRRSSSPAHRRSRAKLDLNTASFEQLRGLGLSVTQSARLIAYRDVNDGFDSLDELDKIPGLPKETRGRLKTRLKLSPRR